VIFLDLYEYPPLCLVGEEESKYTSESTCTIPVHVKQYRIYEQNFTWLEEWYNLLDAPNNIIEQLQSKAENVGSQIISEVSTELAIDDITGYANEERTKIEYLAFTIRPKASTQNIDLQLCTLTVLYDSLSVLELNTSLVLPVDPDAEGIFYTPAGPGLNETILDRLTATEYGIVAIHDPDNSTINTYIINSGDRAILLVNLSAIFFGGVPPQKSISGSLIPEIGTRAVYEITTPALFDSRIVELD
jgi:archaellin